ncbi:hypothetical protein FKP32DRAFT_534403 [Trametes sanguinea]|nr:hypothetical protein FKP32DRAFT_534403 [Trametes sanguinea]
MVSLPAHTLGACVTFLASSREPTASSANVHNDVFFSHHNPHLTSSSRCADESSPSLSEPSLVCLSTHASATQQRTPARSSRARPFSHQESRPRETGEVRRASTLLLSPSRPSNLACSLPHIPGPRPACLGQTTSPIPGPQNAATCIPTLAHL